MFRIDKSSVSYKRNGTPFVLTPAALPAVDVSAQQAYAARRREETAPVDDGTNAEAASAVRGRSQELLSQAEEEAARIVSQAQDDAEDLLDQAAARVQTLEAEAQEKLRRAQEQADLIAAQATKQKEELLRAAQEQAAEILESAREKGFGEGYEAGEKVGQASYDSALQEAQDMLVSTLARVERERSLLIDTMENECLSLSMTIAEKILDLVRTYDENAFRSLVHGALGQIKHEGRVNVRVSPEEYALFFAEQRVDWSNDSMRVTIVQDEKLMPGDLLIESSCETLDAGVHSQLRTLRQELGQMEETA